MAVFYPTVPKIGVNTSKTQSFARPPTPKQAFNPTMRSILDRVGGMLEAQRPLTEQLSFEDFAAPQRGVFNEFVDRSLRPEFERFQLNPFERQLANVSAASNRMYAGNAPARTADMRRQVEMPFFDQVEQVKSQNESMLRDFYNRRISRMGDSATNLNNLGT